MIVHQIRHSHLRLDTKRTPKIGEQSSERLRGEGNEASRSWHAIAIQDSTVDRQQHKEDHDDDDDG